MRSVILWIAAILILSLHDQVLAQLRTTLPGRYALVVGISEYKNPRLRLQYAAKDALDIKKTLLEFGKFKEDNIRLLIDDDATRENIRKDVEGRLKKVAHRNDLVLIYFSGHGAQIVDSDGDETDGLDECLVPWDVDVDDNSSLISDDLFAYWVRNLTSERVLIIFDNCFGGGAAREKGILMPGMKGGNVIDDFSQDLTREVPRQGTALLAASKPEQVSFESDEFKNGVFTHFLKESISSNADNNIDGIIDAQELFYSVRGKTLEYSKSTWKKEQEPIFINTITEKLDIYYLPPKVDSTSSKKIEELRYRAQNEQNSAKRIDILKEALRLDPSNVYINHDLATYYEFSGMHEQALARYNYLLSLDLSRWSFDPPLSALLGDLYRRMGRDSDALLWYFKGLEENPNSSTLCRSLGTLYLSQRDTVEAVQYLNRSLDAQPLQKEDYFDLFYIHFAQNSFETGYQIIRRCYEINPNDFQAIYWVARGD